MALGDSAAQGIGASNPWRSYVGRIAGHIRRTTHGTVGVKNLSISGSTTYQCRINQVPRLGDYEADIVTVSIGANDIGDFHPEKFEKNLRAVYSALPKHAIVADLPFMLLPESERRSPSPTRSCDASPASSGWPSLPSTRPHAARDTSAPTATPPKTCSTRTTPATGCGRRPSTPPSTPGWRASPPNAPPPTSQPPAASPPSRPAWPNERRMRLAADSTQDTDSIPLPSTSK